MLVYNFSSTNLDKFAREKLQSTIPEIRNLLESLGYRVYDENRDGAFFQGDGIEHSETTSSLTDRAI